MGGSSYFAPPTLSSWYDLLSFFFEATVLEIYGKSLLRGWTTFVSSNGYRAPAWARHSLVARESRPSRVLGVLSVEGATRREPSVLELLSPAARKRLDLPRGDEEARQAVSSIVYKGKPEKSQPDRAQEPVSNVPKPEEASHLGPSVQPAADRKQMLCQQRGSTPLPNITGSPLGLWLSQMQLPTFVPAASLAHSEAKTCGAIIFCWSWIFFSKKICEIAIRNVDESAVIYSSTRCHPRP